MRGWGGARSHEGVGVPLEEPWGEGGAELFPETYHGEEANEYSCL